MVEPGPNVALENTSDDAQTIVADEQIVVASDEPTSFTPRRYVRGQFRVLVESLDVHGEATGRVVESLLAPTAAELDEVFGPTVGAAAATRLPATYSFIGGLPGEMVEVEVSWSLPRPGRKRARRTPAPLVRLLAVTTAAAERAEPGCPVFGECGGCQLQHMSYPAQLAWKTTRVAAALTLVGLDAALVLPTLGCEPPWGYRNQMRFSVNREGRAGLTARHSHRVLPLTHCPIAHPRINTALAALAEETLPQPQVLLRYADATGQMLLQPAPSRETRERLAAAQVDLRESDMDEMLGSAMFRIRPSSFFQTNTRQAEHMMALVRAALPGGPEVTLVDAYCGVGVFARLLAPQAGRVLAIEESASAIRDARWNLREWPQVEIVQAKVEEALPQLQEHLDGLVIDPPRAGCQRPVLDALVARRVPRVVCVSCNPDTLARDLAYLCQRSAAYRVVSVQPLDMFPQTAHIEAIAVLEAV